MMPGHMSHEAASDLLAAYALDAVDGAERTELEAASRRPALAAAPSSTSCRDVAGALGNSVERPPEGLWSQIAGALPERPGGRGAAADAAAGLAGAPEPGPRPRRRPACIMARAARGPPGPGRPRCVGRCRCGGRRGARARAGACRQPVGQLQSAAGRPSPVAQALAAPGHRVGRYCAHRPTRRWRVRRAARRAGLPGVLGVAVPRERPDLPALGDRRGQPISLGLLGAAPAPGGVHPGRSPGVPRAWASRRSPPEAR